MKNSAIFFSAAAVLGVVCGGAPVSVSAASPLFLNGTITARLPAKDLPAFRKAVREVLDGAADQSTTQWSSVHGAPHRPLRVALTPLQTVQTGTAGTCRLLSADVSQLQATEKWQFWFCKQGDGQWKASGSQAPR